jgi:hypothetical protein
MDFRHLQTPLHWLHRSRILRCSESWLRVLRAIRQNKTT